jgi:hypothetical protein
MARKSKLYVSIRDSRFAVVRNGREIVERHYSPRSAHIAAKQWQVRAENGFAEKGEYSARPITEEIGARPFKLYVSGNGF